MNISMQSGRVPCSLETQTYDQNMALWVPPSCLPLDTVDGGWHDQPGSPTYVARTSLLPAPNLLLNRPCTGAASEEKALIIEQQMLFMSEEGYVSCQHNLMLSNPRSPLNCHDRA